MPRDRTGTEWIVAAPATFDTLVTHLRGIRDAVTQGNHVVTLRCSGRVFGHFWGEAP